MQRPGEARSWQTKADVEISSSCRALVPAPHCWLEVFRKHFGLHTEDDDNFHAISIEPVRAASCGLETLRVSPEREAPHDAWVHVHEGHILCWKRDRHIQALHHARFSWTQIGASIVKRLVNPGIGPELDFLTASQGLGMWGGETSNLDVSIPVRAAWWTRLRKRESVGWR
jgi:hypothetical protein